MKRRRDGFALIELLIIVLIISVLAALLFAVVARKRPNYGIRCSSNLKQIGIAFLMYRQDYDERLPPTKFKNAQPVGMKGTSGSQSYGWADALYPYLKSTAIFQCPIEGQDTANFLPAQIGYSDYWYNIYLSRLKYVRITNPSRTVMLGDGNDRTEITNASYTLIALPPLWIATEESPARRHFGAANYLFADGHVKTLKPEAISNLPTRQSKSTFSVR